MKMKRFIKEFLNFIDVINIYIDMIKNSRGVILNLMKNLVIIRRFILVSGL